MMVDSIDDVVQTLVEQGYRLLLHLDTLEYEQAFLWEIVQDQSNCSTGMMSENDDSFDQLVVQLTRLYDVVIVSTKFLHQCLHRLLKNSFCINEAEWAGGTRSKPACKLNYARAPTRVVTSRVFKMLIVMIYRRA